MSTTGDTVESPSQPGGKSARGFRKNPVVAVTIGDPAGIGPEIVIKAVSADALGCTPLIVGDRRTLERTADRIGIELDCRTVNPEQLSAISGSDKASLLDLSNVPVELQPGVENPEAGKAAGQFIEEAVKICVAGNADAIATAPINKSSFNAGGYDFPGHTEFLAHLTATEEFSMSFFAKGLRVVLLTNHLALTEAIACVRRDALIDKIRFADREFEKLLGRKVKIAVSALNPHASEGGMFGNEEKEEIEPAVQECRQKYAINVSGPYSPDTVYLRGFEGEFDVVIACYHDQATIAVKCLSFGKGVNVTLGLPIIRTSVDHGTAFEIAGQNRADSGSMVEAIQLAAELANLRMVNRISR